MGWTPPGSLAGTVASRPAATAVPIGTFYYANDSGSEALYRSDGTTWTAMPSSGGGGGGGTGALTVIAETVVSGSSVASVDFTSIPSTYRHLRIVAQVRGTGAFTSQALLAQFNGDTASNYDYQRHYGNSTTSGAAASVAQTSARVGGIVGASGDASKAAAVTIDIPNYAGTSFHKGGTGHAQYFTSTAVGNLVAESDAFLWRSTAAINRVTLFAPSGNIDVGSTFTLYGLATA